MSDTLDQLTDAELSEVFAVEVAGWRAERDEKYTLDVYRVNFGEGVHSGRLYDSKSEALQTESESAAIADAVLVYMEKYAGHKAERFHDYRPGKEHYIEIYPSLQYEGSYRRCFAGQAGTFVRAARLALIRAKRAEKGAAS
jgi:hypothetical protein